MTSEPIRYCKECFAKQQEINKLRTELEFLRARLGAQRRSAKEGALEERQARCGGQKPGHAGHGRASVSEEEADRVERIALEMDTCPDCRKKLLSAGLESRTVTDLRPQRVEKVLLRLERKRCRECQRRWTARAPGVLPRGLYTNALLAHVAEQHYVHGIPLGVIERSNTPMRPVGAPTARMDTSGSLPLPN